ncbi:MAG: glycoside hydrolase family 130 protein [Bacteroidales bacterium]
MQVEVSRKETKFLPDPGRVIARFLYTNDERSKQIIRQVLAMPEEQVKATLNQVLRAYSTRHRNISTIFEKHFKKLHHLFDAMNIDSGELSKQQEALLGSYFTMEYSIESAAFFNPSVVEDPYQSDMGMGEKRVIFSFRATGEGHISSIVFRSAVLDKDSNLSVEPVGDMLAEAERIKRQVYTQDTFRRKLNEICKDESKQYADDVLEKLGEEFTYGELKKAVDQVRRENQLSDDKKLAINQIMWLALSHYEIDFSLDSAISERVIFPISETEKNGIEDARFVKFVDDDGEITYYAVYTAFDGSTILPKLLETKDFYHFKCSPVHGELAQNKGMALFPRKINGKYAALCRIDGVNNYLAYTDNINIWREATRIQEPQYPWEFIQVGNSGSPLETEDGWLVITHGVGPMREYVMGAALYDLEDPSIEIGRLMSPLLSPNDEEREGYVPNVVYSCGSMIHNDDLVIPYAMSDYASTYATVKLKDLLQALKK